MPRRRKSLNVLHPPEHDHALREIDRAALAVAREPEQVVEILRYALAGPAAESSCARRRPPQRSGPNVPRRAAEPRGVISHPRGVCQRDAATTIATSTRTTNAVHAMPVAYTLSAR